MSQSQFPWRDSQFPWHHFVWAGSDLDSNVASEATKYYPLLARESFFCCAAPCTFQVTLDVSLPRMQKRWIDLLLDQEAILKMLREAKEQDPDRYNAATDDWAQQAPMSLNTYLKNLLEVSDPEDVRNISKRNKRFAVLFGPRCFSIFRELEWSETVREENGVDEGLFIPSAPAPPGGPSGTTDLATYRAYLEDIRSEVQCLIHKQQATGELCTSLLHMKMGAQEVPNSNENALSNIERYKLMGVLPDQRPEIVVNAYHRQCELLPRKRGELNDALLNIANDLNSEPLQEYAVTQSSVFENQRQQQNTSDDDGLVSQALTFLGLQPPNKYKAEALVQAFRQKLAKDPDDATTARSMLSVIAQASTDDTFQTTLIMEADAKMSLGASKVVLGLVGSSGFDTDAMDAAKAKIEASKSKEAKATYLDAMEAIADHTNSTELKSAINEMRRANGIAVRDDSGNVSNSHGPVDYELPVGLENIGNTCYLNSLLQYLFTVKPVRDIAVNYESFQLDLDDENIKARLLGGNKMQMDRGEAVVAQAFAQELSDLFANLSKSDQKATRPSQRLANAVLLSTHTLLKDPKQTTASSKTPKPPPLPARPSPVPPRESIEDVEMINAADTAVPDTPETTSTVSSRTLVDEADGDSGRSFDKAQHSFASTVVPANGSVAETGHLDSPEGGAGAELDSPGFGDWVALPSEAKDSDAKDFTNFEMKDVGPTDSNDINMLDSDEQTIDQKVLSALEHQKRSSGTDQQDVEEVMGSILNRLQAAIRPSSIDQSTGIQLEKIMETFFVTTVNYTKKFDDKNYQQEVSFDRSITAFPAPEGTCSLYEALGRNFDQQIIEESKLSRYTAIKTLPPVLHVLIQRSQSMGSKNGNPVVIPETLYMDRYMDAPHDSPEFQQRVKNWVVASRVSDLKSQKAKLGENSSTERFLDSLKSKQNGKSSTWQSVEEDIGTESLFSTPDNWDFDGSVDDEFIFVQPEPKPAEPATDTSDGPRGAGALETELRAMMNDELEQREKALEEHFSELKSIPYRIHAVICHRGQLMSGHYWVWIHDFEEGVWRKYNDSNVEVNRSTDDVLKSLSTSGEPYFLCYVRDEDKDEYVNVPKRRVPTPVEPEVGSDVDAEGELVSTATDADGDWQVTGNEPTSTEKATGHDALPPYVDERMD